MIARPQADEGHVRVEKSGVDGVWRGTSKTREVAETIGTAHPLPDGVALDMVSQRATSAAEADEIDDGCKVKQDVDDVERQTGDARRWDL